MTPMQTILAIEDHADIVEILKYNLSREGYLMLAAGDREKGLQMAREKEPSLILLDLMLPKIDGIEVCRQLKNAPQTKDIPIVMMTAKGEESDVVLGLTLGADDYVVKPFSPKELVARVKAVLRRTSEQKASGANAEADKDVIRVDGLVIDSNRHEVTYKKQIILLTLAEFKLLKTLASQPGRVLTRDQLLERVCGPDITVVDRNIDVHIASLRKKMKTAGDLILTVRGIGYRFKD